MLSNKVKTANTQIEISNNLDMKKNIKKNDIQPNKAKRRLINVFKKKFPKTKPFNNEGKPSKIFIEWNKRQIRKGLTNFVAFDNNLVYYPKKDRFIKKDRIKDSASTILEADILKSRTKNEIIEFKDNRRRDKKATKYISKLSSRINEVYDVGLRQQSNATIINNDRLNNNFDILLKTLNPNDRYVIGIQKDGLWIYITLTAENKNFIRDKVKKFTTEEENQDSFTSWIELSVNNEEFSILNIGQSQSIKKLTPEQKKLYGNPQGSFFPYTHNLDKVDLSRYGVYTKEQDELDDGKYDINCICQTLQSAGIDITKILHIVRNRSIPIKKLEEIANTLNIYITLRSINNEKHLRKYGDSKNKLVKIGLIADHYFLIEDTNYTFYSIKNYDELKDEKDFNKIFNKKLQKKNDRFIDSYKLINYLFENKEKYLEDIKLNQNLYKSIFHNKVKDFGSLEYEEKVNTKINKPKNASTGVILKNIYFDFEATTSRNDGIETEHKAYCVYTNEHRNGFFGEDCAKQLLDDLVNKYGTYKKAEDVESVYKHKKSLRLIAHNAGYDFRFLLKHLYSVDTIEKSNSIMSCKALAYNGEYVLSLQIRCSLKMINMPLKKFGKCFNLDVKKEIMPYSLYTEENVKINNLDIYYCLSFVDNKDKDEYLENCKRWGCIKDDKIDILRYAGEYCYMDCITLKNGYEKFKSLVDEATGQDINDYLTLASMADDYLKQNGCYDNVYQISGVPRHFIQNCVVGGRCMTAKNIKHRKMNCKISDFDAVSLYPSAMNRMDGFLMGRPKVIKNFEPEKYDGYFIKIKITKIKKEYNFPCASVLTDDGIRDFTNDLVDEEVYMDKVGLEDLVNFQGVEYEFIMGYYYDEGRNIKIKETMRHLFNQRLKFKKEKNPIQMVFKELMNSSYGKSFMKPIETEKQYIKKSNFETFLERNYNNIKTAVELPNEKIIRVETIKTIDTHFNNVHCGVEILSMSKRIMYEVMTLAEDKNYNMYITDTDSIHIDSDKVEILGNDFKEKYGRTLIGNDMGQFHTDFELDGAEEEIYAVDSVFLGKKCYCDRLKSKDKDGNEVLGYHIRMKGVPAESIIYKANEEFDGDVIKLYNKLYDDSEGLEFDLLCGSRVRFEFNKNMTINNKNEFKRRVKF